MRPTSAPAWGATLLILCLGSAARADHLGWSFSWSAGPAVVSDGGRGRIIMTATGGDAMGDSDISAVNMRTISNAFPLTGPDVFTDRPYTLTLHLTDDFSGQEGTLTFSGKINGTLTRFSSNLTNTFDSPQTQVLDLGHSRYTVTIGPFVPPGQPGSTNRGSIGASVTVDLSPTPEPSTLALAGVGLTLLGVRGWRKKWRAGA
jgi:hypothetical protein